LVGLLALRADLQLGVDQLDCGEGRLYLSGIALPTF
jgi:hypothetical protein